jgi:hypothetical protein
MLSSMRDRLRFVLALGVLLILGFSASSAPADPAPALPVSSPAPEVGQVKLEAWNSSTHSGQPYEETLGDVGSCGPLGQKNPTWGGFGKKLDGVLVADSGEKLELECTDVGDGRYTFTLYYTSPEGSRWRVGMCPFWTGCNSGQFWHCGDADHNNQPDCLVGTRWVSRDYGGNDLPNPWTGEGQEEPPLLDHAVSIFVVDDYQLIRIEGKYRYRLGPPAFPCSLGFFQGRYVSRVETDSTLGPETEAFFDRVIERMKDLPGRATN